MTFATPDFGTSGGVACLLLLVWALVFALVLWGVARGALLLQRGSPRQKKCGVVLLLVSALLPLSCCLGPSQVTRLVYGNYPLGSYPDNEIREGMTGEEVVAVLGTPHERHEQDEGECWYYWIDSFGISWFAVRFGRDGRVVGTHGN
jgi:hypothetical protein